MIILYYIVGMIISAVMVKIGKLTPEKDYDGKMLTYVMTPLFWPCIPTWLIIRFIGKLHVAIHAVIFHAANLLNMRITKDGDDTVIRFHVSKKAEVSATNN
jgi:hypothetical protein